MPANATYVVEGVLKPDGTLELWSLPPLPPGRVRVTLEAARSLAADVLADAPWPDDSVNPAFDLPLTHSAEPVDTRPVAELLPDPFELTEADTRP